MMADESALHVRVESGAGATVAHVTGDVDLNSSPRLRERFLDLLKASPARLIVDLTGVNYMDSSGVGTLVELKRLIERHGGTLALCGLQPRVRGVFEIAHLDTFFDIAASCDEARNK